MLPKTLNNFAFAMLSLLMATSLLFAGCTPTAPVLPPSPIAQALNTPVPTPTQTAPSSEASPLRFAKIVIPDQVVGGKILQVVYRRLNIPIELVDVPANRALIESSEGRLDGEVQRNIHIQEQYPTLIRLEPAINYIEPGVFTRNLKFTVNGWDSIRDYKICIVRGVGTSEQGTKGMNDVIAVETLDQCLQMLAIDRVEVVVTDLFSGNVAVKKLKLDSAVHPLSPPLQKIETYHYLHEKHRDLIPRVEKVLQEMQASGELEQLRKQFVEEILAQAE